MKMKMSPSARTRATRFGKYFLVDRLGQGGMAEVWRAKILGPAGFQRTVVVKRILPHLAEDQHFVRMFVSEARLSARLSHANIVHVYELGDVDGEYYLAMEYVHGHDLVSVLRAQLMRAVPPPGLGAFVVREVCRALAYAHSLVDDAGQPLGLIHRDVSPSNVMLAFDGSVKLLDFGIAKALNDTADHKTQTGTLKGKFGYMAPEQVEGREIDHRADLFAVGIVLHEVLSGRRLFKGQTDLQTIAMVRDAKLEPPSLFNPEIPPELDRICLKALARDLDRRYARCDEMALELDQVVHQLTWGPERVAGLLRELFPDEPTGTGEIVAPFETSGVTLSGSRRRRLGIAAAVLAVGGGGGLLVGRARHPQAQAQAPLVVAPPSAVTPAVPKVLLRVVSTPPGADVFLDGAPTSEGETPVTLSLERGDRPRKLLLKARGYQDGAFDVTPDGDRALQLSLTPVPREFSEHARSHDKRGAKKRAEQNRNDPREPAAEAPK
jgi:tRNA A-37 threonylcarbamoyl transferase component Bud32